MTECRLNSPLLVLWPSYCLRKGNQSLPKQECCGWRFLCSFSRSCVGILSHVTWSITLSGHLFLLWCATIDAWMTSQMIFLINSSIVLKKNQGLEQTCLPGTFDTGSINIRETDLICLYKISNAKIKQQHQTLGSKNTSVFNVCSF